MFQEKCVYFWPVGTGDSTTFVVRGDEIVFQVDLRHSQKSEDDESDCVPIIDRLEEHLPKVGGRPYLSAFALTHPDKDHIQGFESLLDRVEIGELWFTPRIFREHDDDPDSLREDAKAFREEAHRRVTATIEAGGDPGAGNRVRLIGYDTLLEEEHYKGFPKEFFSIPGQVVEMLDGQDMTGEFRAFIHAPFKQDETVGDRNDTSLALQVILGDDPSAGGVLLFGDHKYPVLRKIFDFSMSNGNDENLRWQVLLAPHHCSKSAMYQDENGKDVLKQDILDDLEEYQVGNGYVIASSNCIPQSNEDGDNPPHAIAKKRYEEIVAGGFLCTHDDGGHAEPLRFIVNGTDLTYDAKNKEGKSAGALTAAVSDARGSETVPSIKVGFG
jgi:beta-lactamase superfamily II metal-dependent hydrolase